MSGASRGTVDTHDGNSSLGREGNTPRSPEAPGSGVAAPSGRGSSGAGTAAPPARPLGLYQKLDRVLELLEAQEERRLAVIEWQRQNQIRALEEMAGRLLTESEKETGLVYLPAEPKPWWRFW